MNTENKLDQIIAPSVLPEGHGNNLLHVRCPTCNTKRNYWLEVGDRGCPRGCVKDGRVKAPKPKLTPEQEEIKRLETELAELEAAKKSGGNPTTKK